MFDMRTAMCDDNDNAILQNNSSIFTDDEQYKQLLQENEDLRLHIYEVILFYQHVLFSNIVIYFHTCIFSLSCVF